MSGLVLSIFPGIDLLGRAFEEEGYCVVRGPDLIWGGDIREFHPPAGVFEGVIGGPPCQAFSALRHLIKHNGHEPRFGNMIPDYERVCYEAQPEWFLMENVPDAPIPDVDGYVTKAMLIRDKWVGGVQPRPRRFSFGTRDGRELDIEWAALMRPEEYVAIVAGHSPVGIKPRPRVSVTVRGTTWDPDKKRPRSVAYSIEDTCEAMGLPRDFTDHMPFTMHGKRSVIGNGVPQAMGRAVAQAVRRATGGAAVRAR